ncbi:MAG: 2-hydroxy-6-oxonona-2,4-dienedioate hydrolase [Solirubrobacteraceae bacterium]|nr:2-hydroxy-6-oxonona-2,4-dienedioate hydrolase [Solirubrobacteraceae bacterium]
MSKRADATTAFEQAEQRLFAACGLTVATRRVRLADPPLAVRVLESGAGPPLLLVHGSGMSASTWAPLMAHLPGHRLIALDLPGFGLSDALDYGGRSLREHAVAQLRSLLDALALERVPIVGTSLGAMWALYLAADAPRRVSAVASLGVPAIALPGMHGDPFFTALSTPGLRHVVARLRSPSVAMTQRTMASGAVGPGAAERAPDGFFATVHEGMRQPGFRTAMLSHMWLAMRRGRPRTENFISDAELRQITMPVLMIWGDEDPYGGPEIGRRAAAIMPDAQLEIVPGRHAPFLDDPERCGAAIAELLRRADARP